jgi:hypothetical protein
MVEAFDRRCRYCNRPITMRLTRDGKWHAFVGQNQHYCLKQKAKMGPSGIAVCAIGVLLLIVLFRGR